MKRYLLATPVLLFAFAGGCASTAPAELINARNAY